MSSKFRHLFVVIGANYGDEGKGAVVDGLARLLKNKKDIDSDYIATVRYNGGANAGHTVETSCGLRHVFHQYGAGTLQGLPTLLSPSFIFNANLFLKEYYELRSKISNIPYVFLHPEARLTLPLDVYLNQESSKQKYNTTGVGIWETICRYHKSPSVTNVRPIRAKHIHRIDLIKRYLKNNALKYYEVRAKELNINLPSDATIKEWHSVFLENISAVSELLVVNSSSYNQALKTFVLIFEGAQGLGLCNDKVDGTPTECSFNKGLAHSMNGIPYYKTIHTIYTSRCYLTRHGVGKVYRYYDKSNLTRHGVGKVYRYYDKSKNNLLNAIADLDQTNKFNMHQGDLKAYPLMYPDFIHRVLQDSDSRKTYWRTRRQNYCLFTWCNHLEDIERYIKQSHNLSSVLQHKIPISTSIKDLLFSYSKIINFSFEDNQLKIE